LHVDHNSVCGWLRPRILFKTLQPHKTERLLQLEHPAAVRRLQAAPNHDVGWPEL